MAKKKTEKATWAQMYKDAKIPEVGSLVTAYRQGVHRVLRVSKSNRANADVNHRLVECVQVTDRYFNPVRNPQKYTCDILYVTSFEISIKYRNYVDPESIIQRVLEIAKQP